MSEDKWLDNAENILLFEQSGQGADPARMLEIGPVNRTINDQDQAYNLMVLRMMARYYKRLVPAKVNESGDVVGPVPYGWIDEVADSVEAYQQTMSGETNSRVQFMKIAMTQVKNALLNTKQAIQSMVEK